MRSFLAIVALLCAVPAFANEPRSLFDGKTLASWETIEADAKWWKVTDGVIAGGSLTENVPHNTFLSTTDQFENFDLTLTIRIRGAGGFINSGIQIRSIRVPKSSEMSGYQVDAGPGWWGKLYDESRRNKVIGEPVDAKALAAAIKENDWNEYRIRAEGRSIKTWINGVAALDYHEADPKIPCDGHIGIQVHGGGKALIEVKDISITVLPRIPGSAKWPGISGGDAMSAAEEVKKFSLADGFTAELVVEESTDPANPYGKFVALAFDAHGRLWTTTALEYPIDANENPEASQRLFASGGRDKVLVIDDPWASKPSRPSVFADGLALPLGVLPCRDGAFVQYGTEIRFYRDTNGDGRADGCETLLGGFGVQDSHLFPHQFTRVPGDWILLAQGLFNKSLVTRPGGKPFADGQHAVPFDACKLARFKPDGSAFESVTAGPNNIWGLTISRTGQMWLQEANDIGFPIFPYEPGVLVPTGSRDRLRPYQPMMPAPLAPPQMGGTGLSGLALADDLDGWPAPWGAGAGANSDEKVFYLANPITNMIQTIIATRNGERFTYRKGPDLLTSADKSFRPVAIQFGPDGCLYIVDWYNKVISHNEVPRNHPERDKVRGRIWRIRHESQPVQEPVAVAKVATDDLPSFLGAKKARIADLAWQEIIDRDAKPLVPKLAAIAADASASSAARAGALWALEGLGATTPKILEALLASSDADVRHEAIRVAGTTCSEEDFRRLAAPLVDDPSPRVRAALGDAFRRIQVTAPETIALIMRLGSERVTGNAWDVYDRDFERYLTRWALERHPEKVAAFLASPESRSIPIENRLLATLALEPRAAAIALAAMLPDIQRPIDAEEIRILASQADVPEVAAGLERLATAPASREQTLRAFLGIRTSVANPAMTRIVSHATKELLASAPSDAAKLLAIEAAGAFALRDLQPQVTAMCMNASASRDVRRAAIRGLREMGAMSADAGLALVAATADDPQTRSDVILAWAESRDPTTCAALVSAWDDLSFLERQSALASLSRHRAGAAALVAGLDRDDIDVSSIPISVLGDLRAVLGKDPVLDKLWSDLAGGAPGVLRLSGDAAGAGPAVSLDGPFTIEVWANLDGPIDNKDSLLASPGSIDLNFFDAALRVWTKAHGDLVVAKTKTTPGRWRHYAITRDAEGIVRIYIDGELDAESTVKDTTAYPNLRIGSSSPKNAGTSGRLAEFRLWNRDRSADEVRADFDRSYAGDDSRPPSLVSFHGGNAWGDLSGKARIEPALDAPKLVTAAELEERLAKFAKFRQLAEAGGDAAKGKNLFAVRCLTCHQQGGQGGKVGPALDGLGLTGTEAILRNVLTPNAAMEGGYRAFRVITKDGRVAQGLLVSQDADAIVLREPDKADLRFPTRDVAQAGFSTISIMPEGLLEAMTPEDVSDLFAYLKTLSVGSRSP
jgi:putative heme-binding domain-containing protein